MTHDGESSFRSIFRMDWGSAVPLLDFITRPKSLLMTLGTPRRIASASSGISAMTCVHNRSRKPSPRFAKRPKRSASSDGASDDGWSSICRNNIFPDDPEIPSDSQRQTSDPEPSPHRLPCHLGPCQLNLPSVPQREGFRGTIFFVRKAAPKAHVKSFIRSVKSNNQSSDSVLCSIYAPVHHHL